MNFFKYFTCNNCNNNINNVATSMQQEKLQVSRFKFIANQRFNLSFASLCLGATCIGLTVGWANHSLTDDVIRKRSNVTCFKCSEDEISTLKLVLNLGGCLGALVPPCLVDIFGRRHNFAIAAAFDLLFWIFLTVSKTVSGIMLGTAMGGFAMGIFLVTGTMYVTEVAPAYSRGKTAAIVTFFAYFGIFLGTSFALVVYHRIIPVIMSALVTGFFATIYLWMIESPYYLYERGETLNAKLALKALRGAQHFLDIDSEYKSLELFFDSKGEYFPEHATMLCSALMGYSRKTWATIIMILMFVSQMVGSYAMDEYTDKFVDELSPIYGKIVLSSLDLCSIAMCVYLIEKIGRKPLLLLSISGSSASCLILAIDAMIHEINDNIISDYNERAITTAIVVLYYTAYSLGLTPILPLLTGEVFPNRIKTIAIGLCISVIYLSVMINQSIFETLNAKRGMYVAFIAFSVIGSLGLFSIFLFLPETTAKSLHQIQMDLDNYPIIM